MIILKASLYISDSNDSNSKMGEAGGGKEICLLLI